MGQLLCDLYGCPSIKRPQCNYHICAPISMSFSRQAGSTPMMWCHYDADYRQKAEATRNTNWSAIDTATFNHCFTGKAKQIQRCTNCNSLKHNTAACPRRKGKCPLGTTYRLPNNQNRGRCATISPTIVHAIVLPAPVSINA